MGNWWRSWATAVTALLSFVLFFVARSYDKGSFTLRVSQAPAPATQLQVVGSSSSTMSIKHGHFVYLVQARAEPCEFWLNVSRRLDSSLIWLTWKEELSSRPKTLASYVYFPKSTFAKGRNRLFEEAKKVEAKQGWKFNYFIFADEDMFNLRVVGRERILAEHDKASRTVNGYPRAIYAFNKLLNIYRPARAGGNRLDYRTFEPLKQGCIIQPTLDAALEAFHRTAVDVLLPYNHKFDFFSAWLSGMMMNMKADLFFRQSSVLFKSIQWMIRDKKALHDPYPRGPLPLSFRKLYRYFHRCWSKSPLSAKARERYPTAGSLNRGVWYGIKVKEATDCVPAAKNVDYGFGKSPEYVRQSWVDDSMPGCTRPL